MIFQKRQDYALLIATDDYDSWSQLSNPIQDAQAIGDTLRDTYGFQVELLKNPTQLEIFADDRSLQREGVPTGRSTSGLCCRSRRFRPRCGRGVYRGKRFQAGGRRSRAGHPYSPLTFAELYRQFQVKHVLVVMDVCFGGTFDRKLSEAGSRGGMYEKLPIEELFFERDKWPTRKFITSGGETYVPDGEPGHHSPFVKNFLEEIRNPPGHRLTLRSLIFLHRSARRTRCPFGEHGVTMRPVATSF